MFVQNGVKGNGMTDISKCAGINCRAKEECYRYTAPIGQWQSWAEYWKLDKELDGSCKEFWKKIKSKRA